MRHPRHLHCIGAGQGHHDLTLHCKCVDHGILTSAQLKAATVGTLAVKTGAVAREDQGRVGPCRVFHQDAVRIGILWEGQVDSRCG